MAQIRQEFFGRYVTSNWSLSNHNHLKYGRLWLQNSNDHYVEIMKITKNNYYIFKLFGVSEL